MCSDPIKILVAIANYGSGNRAYLDRLIATYKSMPAEVSIVVLSNVTKNLDSDVEIRVGLPSRNPWSLPFAHRSLFRERVDDFDLFIYSEDDTLMRWETIEAFVADLPSLADAEIPGFLRTEAGADGTRYFSSCHSHFRWIPSSVRRRGDCIWAEYSNEHSACFMVTRDQLKRAMASGGFGPEPREGRHDMLCTAATDIYTRCGLHRVINLDKLDQYTLEHLPNKYIGRMGLPANEMKWQVSALRKLLETETRADELLDPDSGFPRGVGSKNLREDLDPKLLEALSPDSKVLVWGSGDGHMEQALANHVSELVCVPTNSVLAETCRRRGLRVCEPRPEDNGPPGSYSLDWDDSEFDSVVIVDALHLVDEPVSLLSALRKYLAPDGQLIARVPNLLRFGVAKRLLRSPSMFASLAFGHHTTRALTIHRSRQMLQKAGFVNIDVQFGFHGVEGPPTTARRLLKHGYAPHIYINAARSG